MSDSTAPEPWAVTDEQLVFHLAGIARGLRKLRVRVRGSMHPAAAASFEDKLLSYAEKLEGKAESVGARTRA